MKASEVARCYRALAALATILLWAFFAFNGGLKAMLLAPWTGKLNEDAALKTNYTGVFTVDYVLGVLVAFFHFVTNGSDEGVQLMVVEGYATLQPSCLWLYAEMIRPGSKPWSMWLVRPVVFMMFSQMFGAAISLPLYYSYHVLWVNSARTFPVRDLNAAMALPFSYFLGAVVPVVLVLAPAWKGPNSRPPEAHQNYIALFQPSPLWMALIQTIMTGLLGRLPRSRNGGGSSGNPTRTAHGWTRATYLLAAVTSALTRLYTAVRIYTSTDATTSVLQLRIPSPPSGPARGLPDVLARGALLFLQFDIPIFEFASLSWAFWLLSSTTKGPWISGPKLAFVLLVGYITIGAGATVSLALFVREGLLQVPEGEKAKDALPSAARV
ncbi:hypothetical protein GGR50DRAFT_604920 [Xylaria sp. CBS 124048]|nr:hypothetical protein GGR50DRAFT_604920 [Xylaria sp. CBS 124048]